MKVKKVKGVTPDFHETAGPSETVTLGLEIEGVFVNFGKYYFGPQMQDSHAELCKKMESFIDECVVKFKKTS
jgi:hypothetical protein